MSHAPIQFGNWTVSPEIESQKSFESLNLSTKKMFEWSKIQVENLKLKKSLEEKEKELEEVKQKLLVMSFKVFFS